MNPSDKNPNEHDTTNPTTARRARPEKTGLRAPLGDLELAVMRSVWQCPHDGCRAVTVQQALAQAHPVALTTVLTTMDRLKKKGILRRAREGKAYRYWATVSEDELQERIVNGVMSNLVAQFPKAVAAYFARWEQQDDAQILESLAQRVEVLAAAEAEKPAPPEGS